MVWDSIITAAAVVSALSVLGAVTVKIVRFWLEQKAQEREINHVKNEMGIICYGVLACLDGLKQMGCDGNVTQAKNDLEKYLNKSAHK
ncbi:MAG: branched-chain amino acid ABC transporter permease [Clostridia bacterium]|nr:branched-chain amino acid ABC transporter permease [Clostridia bacterium]MBQ2273802.1 branched-chain amino acid ABC transporter permease [Clostridia bacterium]MBQ5819708.1 branched-chain amino acid ABC transporter permease [Clostridia bacterium]